MSAIRKETTTANYNFIAKDNYLSYTGNNAVRMDLYFSNHSKTPLIWESWSINWGTNPYMPMRHSGKVNMAFLDGMWKASRARMGGSTRDISSPSTRPEMWMKQSRAAASLGPRNLSLNLTSNLSLFPLMKISLSSLLAGTFALAVLAGNCGQTLSR